MDFEPFKSELSSVFEKNPDLAVLKKLKAILESGDISDPNYIRAFECRNAPLVSCEIERVFSVMNSILTDRRHSLTTENLKYILVLSWYSKQCFTQFFSKDNATFCAILGSFKRNKIRALRTNNKNVISPKGLASNFLDIFSQKILFRAQKGALLNTFWCFFFKLSINRTL